MDDVENILQRAPMRIGIGTPKQRDALRLAGVEKHWDFADIDDLLALVDVAIRPGDVVVLAQPSLLSVKQIRKIGAEGAKFEVIGHPAIGCKNDELRRMLRRLKPKDVEVEMHEKRGAPAKYPVPTSEQVAAIVALWHSGMKRARVVEQVGEMVQAKVPMSWVRDQIIKATGTAARRPK